MAIFGTKQPPVPTPAPYWPGDDSGTDSSGADAAYKRSGKTKKDLIATYNKQIKVSSAWRGDQFDSTWHRMVDLYRGKQLAGQDNAKDRIVINVAFSTVNVIVPAVAVNYPQISVGARLPEDEASAYVAEAAVNYWWRRYDWREEVRSTVKDSLVVGHGWVKLGWKFKTKEQKLHPDQHAANIATAQDAVKQYGAANPDLADSLPSDEDVADSMPDYEDKVTADHPSCERVSPFDIYIDPESTYEGDMKWIAQKIVAPLSEVKKDERYKKSARDKLQADSSLGPRWRDENVQPGMVNTKHPTDDDIKRVTLYEYWDIENQFYCVFSKGSQDFLLEPADFPYEFGHPFRCLHNYEVPDQFYSIGDLEMLEPMQQELNAVRSDMMNHRKRWNRAYLALRDKIDPLQADVLESDVDNRIVWIDGDEDLNRVVKPIEQIPLDAQMYQYSEQIENDIELVTGVTDYQRGVQPEIRRTATEAAQMQDNSSARAADKLAQVEAFMADIAECVIQLAQQYMTQDEAARIEGPDGSAAWVQFSRDDIDGDYDYVVDAGSTTPKNEQGDRQAALNLLQVVQPFVGAVIDPAAICTWVLKNAFNIKDPSQFMVQQQPQQQGPQEKIIESLNYRDLPPDIQRQVEAQAGFKPSTVGGSSPHEQVTGKAMLQEQQAGHQLDHHDQQVQDQMLAAHIQQQGEHANTIDEGQQEAAQQAYQQQQQLMQDLRLQAAERAQEKLK